MNRPYTVGKTLARGEESYEIISDCFLMHLHCSATRPTLDSRRFTLVHLELRVLPIPYCPDYIAFLEVVPCTSLFYLFPTDI